MSHVPIVLKSDRSVFDKMLPVDDNGGVFCYNAETKMSKIWTQVRLLPISSLNMVNAVYGASMLCRAAIGQPAKRHSNAVSLGPIVVRSQMFTGYMLIEIHMLCR